MPNLAKRIRDYLSEPQEKPDNTRPGKKVPSRLERMCDAGDENACARLKEAQSTDSNQ